METITPHISVPIAEILAKRVSFQRNTWSIFSKEMTITEVLKEIQSDTHKNRIQELRTLLRQGKKEEYNSHKLNLPAVTFCGTFDGERKKNSIKSYNSIVVLDVDKLDEKELDRVKECFSIESFVFSFWESPSKEGIKGLALLRYDFESGIVNIDTAHKGAFLKLSAYFKENHNIEIDHSGSDTTRLCFLSYDPKLVIKNGAAPFPITELDLTEEIKGNKNLSSKQTKFSGNRDALYNPANRNNPADRYTMGAILRFLEKRKLSITNSYEEWYKVAMAISNTFTYEIGEKYFLRLSSLDIDKFDESNCKRFLHNCYELRRGTIKFSSIVYFANQKGFETKKQRDRGSEVVDENLSQVSSSKTAVHLPGDLNK